MTAAGVRVVFEGVPRLALGLREAAEACGADEQALRAAMYCGDLRGKRTTRGRGVLGWWDTGSGRYLIPVQALEEWLRSDARLVPPEGIAGLAAWLADRAK